MPTTFCMILGKCNDDNSTFSDHNISKGELEFGSMWHLNQLTLGSSAKYPKWAGWSPPETLKILGAVTWNQTRTHLRLSRPSLDIFKLKIKKWGTGICLPVVWPWVSSLWVVPRKYPKCGDKYLKCSGVPPHFGHFAKPPKVSQRTYHTLATHNNYPKRTQHTLGSCYKCPKCAMRTQHTLGSRVVGDGVARRQRRKEGKDTAP